MNTLTRRTFLRNVGLTAGGVAIAGTAGITTIGRVMNPRVAAQTSGQPLRAIATLPTRKPEPGIIEAEIGAHAVTTVLAGYSLDALGYSGGPPEWLPPTLDGTIVPGTCNLTQGFIPGMTLRVREEDTLRLKFINCLPESDHGHHGGHHNPAATNLHLHGPLIAPAVDAPLTVLKPNETRSIDLHFPSESAGTHWYHPHPHGHVAAQLSRGLAGALIVEGGLDDELRDWEEHLLVIQDFQISDSETLEKSPLQGNLITINGQHQPVLQPQTSNLRLRLVNASTARHYRVGLEQHPLHLIATDGHFLEKPVSLQEVVLAPGNRADVLIQLANHTPVRLLAAHYDMPAWVPYSVLPLMTIAAPVARQTLSLPRSLATVETLDPTTAVTTRRLRFSGSDRINGQRFDPHRVDFTAQRGTLEIWELEHSHHPFHLHSYPVQILDRGSEPEPYRAWRDVVESNDGRIVRIAVPFRHYAGRTVFHCHVVQHEDDGMMGIIDVQA